MVNVLIVPLLGLNYEGITSVIYNYCSNIDQTDMLFSFVVCNNVPEELKQRFIKFGKIIFVPNRKQDFYHYFIALNRILEQEKYDVLHIHGNSGTMAIESSLAKLHRVKNIIVHCHSQISNYPLLSKFLVPIMKSTSNHYVACSAAAGKWLFGKNKYLVLNNAIDLQRFQYNELLRRNCRKELNLGDSYVIGHIGHFTELKNHDFLIDIFLLFHKQVPNSKLILVSDGPKFETIRNKVKLFGLEDSVLFLGRRSDTNTLYQAMDIFIFPSKCEGFGIVVLEAQAAGLPLLVSDSVTEKTRCSDRIFYKSLDSGAESWVNTIFQIRNMNFNREKDTITAIRKAGFDIKIEANKLRKLYMQ